MSYKFNTIYIFSYMSLIWSVQSDETINTLDFFVCFETIYFKHNLFKSQMLYLKLKYNTSQLRQCT